MSLFSVEESLINKCIKLNAADLNLAALIVSTLHCYMAESCGDLIANHSGKHFSPQWAKWFSPRTYQI